MIEELNQTKSIYLKKEKQGKMEDILRELRQKMIELNQLKNRLRKEEYKKISALRTKEMLEEIIVPPLKLIKEPKHKKT